MSLATKIWQCLSTETQKLLNENNLDPEKALDVCFAERDMRDRIVLEILMLCHMDLRNKLKGTYRAFLED